MGPRMCLGDKLAVKSMFLMLVRFFQKIKGYQISLPNGPNSGDLDPDPYSLTPSACPKPYEIILTEMLTSEQ